MLAGEAVSQAIVRNADGTRAPNASKRTPFSVPDRGTQVTMRKWFTWNAQTYVA